MYCTGATIPRFQQTNDNHISDFERRAEELFRENYQAILTKIAESNFDPAWDYATIYQKLHCAHTLLIALLNYIAQQDNVTIASFTLTNFKILEISQSIIEAHELVLTETIKMS